VGARQLPADLGDLGRRLSLRENDFGKSDTAQTVEIQRVIRGGHRCAGFYRHGGRKTENGKRETNQFRSVFRFPFPELETGFLRAYRRRSFFDPFGRGKRV
jgi:hypothetical protein